MTETRILTPEEVAAFESCTTSSMTLQWAATVRAAWAERDAWRARAIMAYQDAWVTREVNRTVKSERRHWQREAAMRGVAAKRNAEERDGARAEVNRLWVRLANLYTWATYGGHSDRFRMFAIRLHTFDLAGAPEPDPRGLTDEERAFTESSLPAEVERLQAGIRECADQKLAELTGRIRAEAEVERLQERVRCLSTVVEAADEFSDAWLSGGLDRDMTEAHDLYAKARARLDEGEGK